MKKTTITILSLLIGVISFSQYQLVWSDEFDGTELNTNIWNYELGASGWGNNEWQYYTNSTNNVDVDTGYLRITAIEESFGGANYTSARITTENNFEFQYGKIEARMKLPIGNGLWPAFWMLGANFSTIGWPMCGEIDIMEHINYSAYVHGTIHYENNGHTYQGQQTWVDVTEFQNYSITWDEEWIRWYVNDNIYYSQNIFNGNGSKEEFHFPFFIILNLAVGGNWPGYPDANTPFPSSVFVDYVRVYSETASIDESEAQTTPLIYPNPGQDIIQLQNDVENVQIYNLQGELILEKQTVEKSLDISGLSEGVYLTKMLLKNGENRTEKLLKD